LETTTPYCRQNNTHHNSQLTKTGRRNLRALQPQDPGIHERFVKAKSGEQPQTYEKAKSLLVQKKRKKEQKHATAWRFEKQKLTNRNFRFSKCVGNL